MSKWFGARLTCSILLVLYKAPVQPIRSIHNHLHQRLMYASTERNESLKYLMKKNMRGSDS